MKAINGKFHRERIVHLTRTFMIVGLLFCAVRGLAQFPPGTNSQPWLDYWSFSDTNNWTSDLGYAPLSFTNLAVSDLGDGSALVVDSTNVAGLQYNVYENDGTTNLTVDQGSVTFWFAPTSWSGTNEGGTGPGDWGRLIEVGSYTTNSSYGWWSLYVDPAGVNLYFSTQTNDSSGNVYTYLLAPIDWTTNRWHFIALTYSVTNTALYVDGALATNGPPLTVYPSQDVLTNGFLIGSDSSSGLAQAHGMFDDLATYNYPLDSNTISSTYGSGEFPYYVNPMNFANSIASADYSPDNSPTTPDVITGQGNLQFVGSASSCSYGTNAYNIWFTNVVAHAAGNGTMNLTFTIEGGADSTPYDVFASSVLGFGTNTTWAWMGQGYHCNTYMLTNLPNTACFLILGTPQDSDNDGLTDAYEKLVSHTNPNNSDTDGSGLLDGWQVLLGLNPLVNQVAQPGTRSNYSYDLADWLEGISGIRTGSVTLDAEGNVLSVSQ